MVASRSSSRSPPRRPAGRGPTGDVLERERLHHADDLDWPIADEDDLWFAHFADSQPFRGDRAEHRHGVVVGFGVERAAVGHRPAERSSRPGSAPARHAPVSVSGMRSCGRRPMNSATVVRLRRSAGVRHRDAVSGRVESPTPKPSPGVTVKRLVPSASSWSNRSDFDDSDKPSTPTNDAMPIEIPRTESAARTLRARSPPTATRTTSEARSKLRSVAPADWST